MEKYKKEQIPYLINLLNSLGDADKVDEAFLETIKVVSDDEFKIPEKIEEYSEEDKETLLTEALSRIKEKLFDEDFLTVMEGLEFDVFIELYDTEISARIF